MSHKSCEKSVFMILKTIEDHTGLTLRMHNLHTHLAFLSGRQGSGNADLNEK